MSTHKEAMDLLRTGQYLRALCISAPILKRHPADLTAWYLTARSLHGLGETELSLKNLRNLAKAHMEKGRPIAALSLIKELEDFGQGIDDLFTLFAELYGMDSPRVEESELAPPPLPSIAPFEPWDDTDNQKALVDQAAEIMAVAWGEALIFSEDEVKLPYVPLLSALDGQHLVLLLDNLIREVFEAEKCIVEQDSIGDGFYIIVEGEVAVRREQSNGESRELARLGPGAFFGEMAIVSRAPRAANVISVDRTVVLRADKRKLEELATQTPEIGNVLVAFCHARMIENLMRVSPVLSPVPVSKRPDVISLFQTDYADSGEVIIEEAQEAPGLFLIVSGKVDVLRSEGQEQVRIASLGAGDIIGEISLLMRRPSTATVIAVEPTALLFLPATDFFEVTREFPELLKGAFDIALERDVKNNSILASTAAAADDLVLV